MSAASPEPLIACANMGAWLLDVLVACAMAVLTTAAVQVFGGLKFRFTGYHTQRRVELTRQAQRFGATVCNDVSATHLVACTCTDRVCRR